MPSFKDPKQMGAKILLLEIKLFPNQVSAFNLVVI